MSLSIDQLAKEAMNLLSRASVDPAERLIEIVERDRMSDDLTDDDFAALAADMFRTLDDEEKESGRA